VRLTGEGSLSVDAFVAIPVGQVHLVAQGDLVATATLTADGRGMLQGAGSLSCSAGLVAGTGATLTGETFVNVRGQVIAAGVAHLVGDGSLICRAKRHKANVHPYRIGLTGEVARPTLTGEVQRPRLTGEVNRARVLRGEVSRPTLTGSVDRTRTLPAGKGKLK
jgi:hypothetical protein